MTFEQPPNPSGPIQFTWSLRWKLFKAVLPILIFGLLILFQALLLQQWVRGHWDVLPFLEILGVIIFLFFGAEIQFRLGKKLNKKFIELRDDYVRTSVRRLRWPQIIAWQFNNLPGEKDYRVVTMEYKWGRNKKRYVIILQSNPQIAQLISELNFRKQKNGLAFEIRDQEADFSLPVPRPKAGATQFYLYLAGAFLVIEGLPFLLVGSEMQAGSPDPDFATNPNGNFARFIQAHFSTVAELKHFCLLVGGILCGTGLVFIILSLVLRKKILAASPRVNVAPDSFCTPR